MSAKKIRISCSALPAAFACPGSIQPVLVRIKPVSKPADEGNASHEVMSRVVDMDLKSTHDIDVNAIARRFDVDPEDLQIQAFVSVWVWSQLKGEMAAAQAEVTLNGTFELDSGTILELRGRLDILSVAATLARLGDWKWGRVDGDYAHQVRGYSATVIANYPKVEQVDSFVAWMRTKDIERYSMTRDQIWEWLAEFDKRVANWDGVYHPGPQCPGCPRSHECPAWTAIAKRDVEVFGGAELAAGIAAGLIDLPDAQVVELYRRAGAIKKVIDSLGDAVKMRVRNAGGALSDGAGRELRFVESMRRKIDPLAAMPVLEHLSDGDLAKCLTISASALDEVVADLAPKVRGSKKKAIEEMKAALIAAGALNEEPSERLMDLEKEPTK